MNSVLVLPANPHFEILMFSVMVLGRLLRGGEAPREEPSGQRPWTAPSARLLRGPRTERRLQSANREASPPHAQQLPAPWACTSQPPGKNICGQWWFYYRSPNGLKQAIILGHPDTPTLTTWALKSRRGGKDEEEKKKARDLRQTGRPETRGVRGTHHCGLWSWRGWRAGNVGGFGSWVWALISSQQGDEDPVLVHMELNSANNWDEPGNGFCPRASSLADMVTSAEMLRPPGLLAHRAVWS